MLGRRSRSADGGSAGLSGGRRVVVVDRSEARDRAIGREPSGEPWGLDSISILDTEIDGLWAAGIESSRQWQ